MSNCNILREIMKIICLFVTYFIEKVYFCNRKLVNE
jgi:hypothetical protein